MIQATINSTHIYTIDADQLNGEPIEWDILALQKGSYHILKNDMSYRVTLVSHLPEEKLMVLRVNGTDYDVAIKDKYDLLLQQMGISNSSSAQVNKFKAPMPGLIREVMVAATQTVKKGDILLILEAMKMENALKSPRDGAIRAIAAVVGAAVEKGEVLIEFE